MRTSNVIDYYWVDHELLVTLGYLQCFQKKVAPVLLMTNAGSFLDKYPSHSILTICSMDQTSKICQFNYPIRCQVSSLGSGTSALLSALKIAHLSSNWAQPLFTVGSSTTTLHKQNSTGHLSRSRSNFFPRPPTRKKSPLSRTPSPLLPLHRCVGDRSDSVHYELFYTLLRSG